MNHRRDIDGLRAVAVLPVLLFHAGFTAWVPGGFVGVDVFFVISGYLITGLLLQDLAAGRFSLATFYERRARRLLPALFAMLALTAPLAWAWLVPPELKAHAGVLMAAVAFGANLLLWAQAGYFDTAAELKPLLHTWSLGVEEQFYLLFPPLLWLLWRGARSRVFAALLLATLASLAAAHWGALHKPAAAYFLLPTRAWELGLGALVAVAQAGLAGPALAATASGGPAWLRQAGSLAGLGAIAAACLGFSRHTPWPGLAALLPTLGTAALLAFGGPGTWAGRLLACAPLVGLGLVSYSAYLWHQPLLAFARAHSLGAPAPALMAALLLLTLGLAWASWRWVEQPWRTPGRFSRRQVLGWGLGGALGLLGLGAAGGWAQGWPARMPLPPSVQAQFEGSGLGQRLQACYGAPQQHRAPQWWCGLGGAASDAPPRFLLLGDSHARAIFPAFEAAAAQAGVRGGFIGSSACPPLQGVQARLRQADGVDCQALNTRVLALAREQGVKRVYLLGRWSAYADEPGLARESLPLGLAGGSAGGGLGNRSAMRPVFLHGLAATVAAYGAAGIEVVVVAQVPEQQVEPRHAYHRLQAVPAAQREALLRQASPPVARHRELQAWVNAAFAREQAAGRLRLLSFDPLLCDATHCPVGDAQLPHYADDNHLSLAGAARLAPSLIEDLRPLR